MFIRHIPNFLGVADPNIILLYSGMASTPFTTDLLMDVTKETVKFVSSYYVKHNTVIFIEFFKNIRPIIKILFLENAVLKIEPQIMKCTLLEKSQTRVSEYWPTISNSHLRCIK